MRTLYTVSHPDLAPEDRACIARFRDAHDLPFRDVIAAHFTLVFGVQDIEDMAYESHIRAVAAQSPEVRFTCRYAMLGADPANDTAHVYLVPDEGNAAISLLHDRLYAGPLERFHRLDIPSVPHITVATTKDREHAKSLCSRLNQAGLCISGALRSITIGALEAGKFTTLAQVPLNASLAGESRSNAAGIGGHRQTGWPT